MQRYDILLLDADNTLFDFTSASQSALRETLTHWQLAPAPERISRYERINRAYWDRFNLGGISREELTVARFRDFLPAEGVDASEAERVNEYYLTALGRDSRLLPGAEEFCRRLSTCCRLFIVTNGMALTQTARMAQTPIRSMIEHVFVSQLMQCQKPQKIFYERVLSHIAPPDRSRVLLIGDELQSDILGGLNAGLDTLWYNPKHLPPDPDIPATYTAASFEEMAGIILGNV